MNRLIKSTFIFSFLILFGCGGEAEKKKVENLVVIPEVSVDGSGIVTIITFADNAKYFRFFFGDVDDEVPVEQAVGPISHTYENSGTYTITVQAHRSETDFISESVEIEIDVFIAIPTTGQTTPLSYENMTLLWQDEFDGSAVDQNKWTFELGNNNGWGNNELQYYRQQNASIIEGNLMIEARAEEVGGKSYTSSRMITKGKFDFKYGRVDVRAALPEGQGIWPAIWMLGANIDAIGWPKCGEVDIMEMIGGGAGRDNKVYGTAHWFGDAYASYGGSTTLTSGTFNDEFHVFSITWDESYIRWYMDDIKYHEILITPAELSEFKEDFFLILNIAVGGNWPQNPDASTKFPQRMFVDYIRVFQPQ
jgi:beta-glucanase (GH16 family)